MQENMAVTGAATSPFENNIVKRSVQCHVFAQLPKEGRCVHCHVFAQLRE